MWMRRVAFACLGLAPLVVTGGCASKHSWSTHAGVEAAPSNRAELERLREAALGSEDVGAMRDYLEYLWRFNWEHREYLARMDAGKGGKLPADLEGYDQKKYVDEAIAAWSAMRPLELPEQDKYLYVHADYMATAAGWGCRDTELALSRMLIFVAETAPQNTTVAPEHLAVLKAECGVDSIADNMVRACRYGLDLLGDGPEPEYDDLDQDMAPEPSVRVKYMTNCDNYVRLREWASEDQLAMYGNWSSIAGDWMRIHHPEEWAELQKQLARQREAAAREAERREAERAAQQAQQQQQQQQGGGGSSTGSAGTGVVSVRLYNACPETVRLFFGDKPKFGSGTSSTLSSNTTISEQMRPGDMIWITDDSGNGLSSWSAPSGSASIEITPSCTGFRPR